MPVSRSHFCYVEWERLMSPWPDRHQRGCFSLISNYSACLYDACLIIFLVSCYQVHFRPSWLCVIFSHVQWNICLLPLRVACILNLVLWPVNCLNVTTMPTYVSFHCVLTSLGDMYRKVWFCAAETLNAVSTMSEETKDSVRGRRQYKHSKCFIHTYIHTYIHSMDPWVCNDNNRLWNKS